MSVVKIEPTRDHPVPYSTDDDCAPTLIEALAVAGNTAELQAALGATIELNEVEDAKQARLLEEVIKSKKTKALSQPQVALAAASFLREYGKSVALDVAATRSAITYKLMEIANCGDPKFELKALELLGKHSDIGLFSERSEITINYKTPEALEDAIKERVKRLLNADIIDVTPIGMDIEEELGISKRRRAEEDVVEAEPEDSIDE